MSNSSTRPVRVRVAPSPTGDPHVGTGYIALFNRAFAKASGGQFILRIEDTDRERSNAESERQIFHSLRWLGLDWDEGPDVGGPKGPYRQSERRDIYKQYGDDLVAKGKAYPCFCTSERLAELRQTQKEQKLDFGYDGHCRELAPEEVQKRIDAGEPHVIRLAIPAEGQTVVRDLVRGEVVFQNKAIDDQVLLKSDGFPTYHLANVVDDHLMEITHVIRAEEWISSTPKHILLYEAFGWEAPAFIHMPLLRNTDKSKISKRKNPTSLLWYEEQGFLPEALRNFLALMGFSAEEGKEKFSFDQMVAEFSWRRVSTSAPVFDMQKLEWLNGVYIRDMAASDLAQRLRATALKDHPISDDLLMKSLPLVQERMKKLTEFLPQVAFILEESVEPPQEELIPKKSGAEEVLRALDISRAAFAEVSEWTTQALEDRARRLSEETDIKGRTLFMVLRVAITGSKVSPPLFESMELVGRDRCLARLEKMKARVSALPRT